MSEDAYYEIAVVRHRPVADEAVFVAPVDRIVRAVQGEDPARFRLFAYSPARELYPVLQGDTSIVDKFVMTSEIEFGFGRTPADPTHEVIFSDDPEEKAVFLRIQFVVAGNEAACPGVVAELHLRADVVADAGADPTARLDRLFSALIEALQPDHGHVLLPGHPEPEGWPNTPEAGWLTYLARPTAQGLPRVPAPSVAAPFAAGVKIRAAPGPAPDGHGGGADAITVLRGVIHRL